jgi:hypothetical protein
MPCAEIMLDDNITAKNKAALRKDSFSMTQNFGEKIEISFKLRYHLNVMKRLYVSGLCKE